MSIAVSTIIFPSRLLIMLVSIICCCCLVVAAMIGVGDFALLSTRLMFILVLLCAAAPLVVMYRLIKSRQKILIDISGIGEIRLGRVASTELPSNSLLPHKTAWERKKVQLMPDSTIWTYLLLLRFQTEDQQIIVVPVLPDSISGHDFRALLVAFRWIVTHCSSSESIT